MKGLFLKDLYALQRQRKVALQMLVILLLLFVVLRPSALMLASIISVLAASLATGLFGQEGTTTRWDCFAAALPLPRKTTVVVRYTMALGLVVCGGLLAAMAALAAEYFFAPAFLPARALYSVLAALLPGFLSLAVGLPIAFATGTERAQKACSFIVLLPGTAFLSGSILFKEALYTLPINAAAWALPAAGISLLALVLFGASYLLSVRLYAAREF